MARSYAALGSVTNTVSTTLPLLMVMGAANIRTKIYEINLGTSATPADAAARYAFQRATTAGTPGSSVTPQPIDAADPAAISTVGLAVYTSTPPVLTANQFVWGESVNQRATFRWVAQQTKELVIPAVANNGLALMSQALGGTAYAIDLTVYFEE